MPYRFILLAVVLWILWRYIATLRRAAGARDEARDEARREAERRGPDGVPVEDLVQCAACGAYVPLRGGTGCDRPGCPKRQ